MILTDEHLRKTDHQLSNALILADRLDQMRVIITLREIPIEETIISPENFPNRTAWRQELIDKRKQAFKDTYGETFKTLEKIGLRMIGEKIMRVIVTDGSATQIVSALELSEIESATLDTTF